MIGFVFQNFHLIPFKSAIENVSLPLYYQRVPKKERIKRAQEMLEKVRLADRANHHPNELSGGQKQRVAIARALITHPELILADEPTGALDASTTNEIMNLFEEINNEGKTILIVTHEQSIVERCKRKIEIRDGRIIGGQLIQHQI
jgi:putative ABC transport system ATP-binding protein